MKIKYNLRLKITFAIFGLWLLTILSGAVLILNQNERYFRNKYNSRMIQFMRNGAKTISEPLLNGDDLKMFELICSLSEELKPIEIRVIDNKINKIVAATNLYNLGSVCADKVCQNILENQAGLLKQYKNDTLFYSYPVKIGKVKLGDLLALSSAEKEAANLKQELEATVSTIFYVSLFTFFVGLLGIFLLTRQILKPLDFISEGIRRISRGDESFRLKLKTGDEFEQVGHTFNTMLDRIESKEHQILLMNQELEKKIKQAVKHSVQLEKKIAETERMASVGRLAGSIAHELNNPLAAILMYARLSEEQAVEPVLRENLAKIIRNTVRARDTIKDLVDYTRHSKIDLKPADPRILIQTCAANFERELKQKKISLSIISNIKDKKIALDAQHLERIFNNLIQNSIDAMPDGGKIIFQIDEKIKYFHIRVSDNGKGIAAKDMKKIFEPFFSTKESGTGVGLFLTYEIIQAHQGKIEVKSRPGQGTTFIIKLPKGEPLD